MDKENLIEEESVEKVDGKVEEKPAEVKSKPKSSKKSTAKKSTKKSKTSKTKSKSKSKTSKPKAKVAEKKVEEEKEEVVEEEVNKPQDDEVIEEAQEEEKKENKKDFIRAPRIIPKEEFEKKKPKEKRKKDEPIEIERFNPSYKIGLTTEQVEQRVEQKLNNIVNTKNTKTYKSIILGNIFTFFNLLCVLVAVALVSVGAWTDCFFIVIVIANTSIGIIQEIKAKKTIEKISLVSSPTALVVRDKLESNIAVSDIVLDDIVVLQTGKQICADSVVVEGTVEVNESLLTGESVAIKKTKGDILYSGSFVVGGKCYARVDKVGNDTYTAKLASQAKQYHKPKSELMGTLNTIILIIGIIIVPLAILMFNNNYAQLDMDVPMTIRKTAGSIIGMIPSGMFLLTSMALAVAL
ncbi:MAG: hypothetical protein E7375_04355 [Clostridiales bacterium]|nr:hypothetical protein [Clostridiales bacterium]